MPPLGRGGWNLGMVFLLFLLCPYFEGFSTTLSRYASLGEQKLYLLGPVVAGERRILQNGAPGLISLKMKRRQLSKKLYILGPCM